MGRAKALLLALVLLSGCETLNATLVRQRFKDRGLSHRVAEQIKEGLEKRQRAPAANTPTTPAPGFMDQG